MEYDFRDEEELGARDNAIRLMKRGGIGDEEGKRILGRMGRLIGAGADGCVFEYGKRCVIKFSVPDVMGADFEKMAGLVRAIRGREWSVRVFELRRLGQDRWFTVMERLERLNEVERAVVNRIGMRAIAEFKASARCQELCSGLRRFGEETGFRYGDLHGGNVMKRGERLKLIDLDGFLYKGICRDVYGEPSVAVSL